MTSTHDSPLGDFLRASRARVEPADRAGRRVPGLRREEVAELAGVSTDYYTRLEQGRERGPSTQVLDAIGRALDLDPDAAAHLYRLAGLAPATVPIAVDVHPSLLTLLDSFPNSAAYVLGPAFDILATNRIADALLVPFGPRPNMVRVLFLHPAAREVFAEWPAVASATVAALRLNAARFDDARITTLVAELLDASDEFRQLWQAQAVGGLTRAFKVFRHPLLGRIELTYQTFDVQDAAGQQLLVGTPASPVDLSGLVVEHTEDSAGSV